MELTPTHHVECRWLSLEPEPSSLVIGPSVRRAWAVSELRPKDAKAVQEMEALYRYL